MGIYSVTAGQSGLILQMDDKSMKKNIKTALNVYIL